MTLRPISAHDRRVSLPRSILGIDLVHRLGDLRKPEDRTAFTPNNKIDRERRR